MLFEPAGVLHVVDWITVGRLPYRNLIGYDVMGVLHSTEDVMQMDFEVFVGGHGEIGYKADVAHYQAYMEALHEAVLDGIITGKSLETLKKEIRLDDFADIAKYEEWLPDNIEGVYHQLVDGAYIRMRPEVP